MSIVIVNKTAPIVEVTSAGPQGAPGPGVASGGTTNQVLAKASNGDYDTVWVTAAGTGTVTSVNTGSGISGGPITTSGTISLSDTTVVPGVYAVATITVDQKGRITAASSGSAAGTDIGYVAATRLITSSTGSGVALPVSTVSSDGLQSAADKSKLDGIEAGAQVNVGTNLSYTASTRLLESSTGVDVTLPLSTTTEAGLQSAADKSKLDGIEAGAQVNIGTNLNYTASTRLLESNTGTDVTLPLFTNDNAGLVGGSGGGTTNFLRADGTWSAPVGGVTAVTAVAPITSSGGSAPVISTSMATNRLLGRTTAGTGVAEEISVGSGLSLSAGSLSAPAPARAAALFLNTFCM